MKYLVTVDPDGPLEFAFQERLQEMGGRAASSACYEFPDLCRLEAEHKVELLDDGAHSAVHYSVSLYEQDTGEPIDCRNVDPLTREDFD